MAAQYDLVVRNGIIVDGTGAPRFKGDVAVSDGKIAAIGEVSGSGIEEIDATGRIVTPGFVDIHTHYDGHATWTSQLQPSSQHGVTTVLAGNCGVGFAPCKAEDRDRLVALMEGVEDIPEPVMTAGLPWNWESFPEYLDSLDKRSFDIDIATQVPHAPLRVYVMGDRAADKDPATSEDIARMAKIAREAVEAGALGFSTSRSLNHKANDGTITYSYAAASDELAGIARGLGESGQGVLQLISDFEDVDAEFGIVERMVSESGRPLSLSLLQSSGGPADRWRKVLDRIEGARAKGAPIRAQISGRPIGLIIGLDFSRHPFATCETYREIAHLDAPARLEAMRDPQRRRRMLDEFAKLSAEQGAMLSTNFANMYEMDDSPDYEPKPEESIAARAQREGKTSAELAYDVLVDGTGVIYYPAANYRDNSIEPILTMLGHEATTFGLGDGGAHCGMICDASLPTYYLERWTGEIGGANGKGRMPLEKLVKRLTMDTADLVGLGDRGQIKVGLRADLNVIDLDNVALMKPEAVADLPDGAKRLGQRARGYDATIVSGVVTYRHGEHTGALPGKLVRGARPRVAA